jgi:hypothetical protein
MPGLGPSNGLDRPFPGNAQNTQTIPIRVRLVNPVGVTLAMARGADLMDGPQ